MNKSIKTLKDLVNINGEKYRDNVAVLEKRHKDNEFKEYLYSDLKEDVIDFATALISKYNLKDEKIAVIGENSYEWLVTYLAVSTGAGVIVPLDKELPGNEIVNLIKRSEASCLVFSSKKSKIVDEIKKEVPTVKTYIEMYSDEIEENVGIPFKRVIKEGRELVLGGDTSYQDVEIKPDDFRILLFTSGTTSAAKGVMLTNGNIIANLESGKEMIELTPEDRTFSVLPMHHTYECSVTYMYGLYSGASIAICQGLKYLQKNILETKPTFMAVVPLLIDKLYKKIKKGIDEQGKEKLVNNMIKITNGLDKVGIKLKRVIFKDIHEKLGGNLKYLLVGSAPIDKELILAYENLGICVLQGYGLTETAPLISGTHLKTRKAGSVGTPSKAIKVKLDNVNEDGVGEILVKGPNVMLGYYKDEEKTKEVLQNGWFRTEDLGYQDDKGNYYICGRSKNVIVTKNGKKIFPEELEHLVNNIPEVKESLVYGKENEIDPTDPEVSVIVTLDSEYLKEKYGDKIPSIESLQEKIWKDIKDINRTLVPYKIIKSLKVREGDFEKTTTMKIKRFIELKNVK